ncbi:MAG: twin-arginine translocation pathway signal protein, partial [Candidatus Paceibacterota bacterium]
MDRKESIKTLLMGSISLPFLHVAPSEKTEQDGKVQDSEPMSSHWAEWPDMPWTGPEYWGNRLQDWRIVDGKAECIYSGPNRTLHCLTHQLKRRHEDFSVSVETEILRNTGSRGTYAGFRLGAKAGDFPAPVTFRDYRRAAVFGEGLDAGVTVDGQLFIGETKSDPLPETDAAIRLHLDGTVSGRTYTLILSAYSGESRQTAGSVRVDGVSPEELEGNVALISHVPSGEERPASSARFSDWQLTGSKFVSSPGKTFGPICFAQYTLNRNLLKVTAQLTPVETIAGHQVLFQVRENGSWKTLQQTTVHELARTAHFRFEDWPYDEEMPYRIQLELPLKDGVRRYSYEGTIAAEPVSAGKLRAAVFSCNKNWGFP